MPMTDEEYVAKSGSICPFCGSPDIGHDGEPDYVADEIYIPLVCSQCGEDWEDHYRLVGYHHE